MAALVFEMRIMQADAIISLDGYEAKAGSVSTLRESPFFDPLRQAGHRFILQTMRLFLTPTSSATRAQQRGS